MRTLLHATAFPDVNALLARLLPETRAILEEHFVGMYLHGSLAVGDFDPNRSDIDFVVVTDRVLPPALISGLAQMHAGIASSGLKWRTNYEGSYIARDALRRHDPAHSVHPAVRVDGSFGVDRHGSEWVIQRYVIREKGLTLAGPDPKTLIDSISPNDLRRAVQGLLLEWWAPQVQDPYRLQRSEYQAYAVLTMCRALYTLEHGTIVSKPVAARWAVSAPGVGQWAALIERALAWRHGVQLDHTDAVLRFIQQTIAYSQALEAPGTRSAGPGTQG